MEKIIPSGTSLTFTKYKREISRLLAEMVVGMIGNSDDRIRFKKMLLMHELDTLVNSHILYRERLKLELDRKVPLTWPV